jgi:hypothetical protein
MKKKLFLLMFVSILVWESPLKSQVPPPPANHGSEGGPVGGSAPIGDGTLMLIFLAAAYASRKVYLIRKKDLLLNSEGDSSQ